MLPDDDARLSVTTLGVIGSPLRGRAERDRNAALPDARFQTTC
jgi:hypothetical protein